MELREFHQSKSAFGKLLSYQQTLQLGLSAVKVCFNKVLCAQYADDDSFMEQLFCVIFFKCGERRMMLEGIQDLLMVCKDQRAILEKKAILLSWVEDDPASILLKARQENTALPLSEYVMDMHNTIASTFKRSLTKQGNLCIFRERILLRYVVYMQLQLMDKNLLSKSQKSLVSYRNPNTPVEESVFLRLNDEEQRSPNIVVRIFQRILIVTVSSTIHFIRN